MSEQASNPQVDLDKTVYETCTEFPIVKEIMARIGFAEITKPGLLQSMGRMMTIRKGSEAKGVPLETIVAAFEAEGLAVKGFTTHDTNKAAEKNAQVEGLSGSARTQAVSVSSSPIESKVDPEVAARQEELANMIRRLSAGEDLERVRADFVRDFANVSATEITQAEQKLINDGMPIREVQQLCDVHSALFHGKTEAELGIDDANCLVIAGEGEDGIPQGHPIAVLKRENSALGNFLDELEKLNTTKTAAVAMRDALTKLRDLKKHYGKKEQLLMPLLDNYGFDGPSNVMWGVDDEILAERSKLVQGLWSPKHSSNVTEDEVARIKALIDRVREMMYKEENILFPLALDHFTKDEWYSCYRDLGEFGLSFDVAPVKWLDGDVWINLQPRPKNPGMDAPGQGGRINLPTGSVSVEELVAAFKLLPVDLTFIDDTERTRFFTNEGHVFDRPLACINRPIWACHPPMVIPMVKKLVSDFKSGERDFMEVWNPNPANPVRVVYYAVRDEAGTYMGTLEVVQQFGELLPKLREIMNPQA